MKLTDEQRKLLRQAIGPMPVVSKRAARIFRWVAGGLLLVWLLGAFYFHEQVKNDERKLEQAQIEANRREERLRRDSAYQQELHQRNQTPRTRNVFDGR